MESLAVVPRPLLLDGFSEPYLTVDNVPHYGQVHTEVVNENLTDHERLQRDLGLKGAYRDGGFVGFGGWVNLGYIAEAQPAYAVLADINPLQAVYWQFHLNTIAACASFEEFKAELPTVAIATKLWAQQLPVGLSGNPIPYRKNGKFAYSKSSPLFRNDPNQFEMSLGCYGLQSRNYARIRAMVENGQIELAVVDAKDREAMSRLSRSVKQRAQGNATLVHISNLMDFIADEETDWANTLAGEGGRAQTKRNILTLAHGPEVRAPGGIVWTRAKAASGRDFVRHCEVLDIAALPPKSAFRPEQDSGQLFHPRDLAPAG